MDHPVCELKLTFKGDSVGPHACHQETSKVVSMNMKYMDGAYRCTFRAKVMFEKEVNETFESCIEPISMFGTTEFKVLESTCVHKEIHSGHIMTLKAGEWCELEISCIVKTEEHWPQLER